MLDASITCAVSGPGVLVSSAPPARGPGGSSGEVLGRVGEDESQPAEAAASLSSCQMSPKGWKNRSGLGVLHRARLLAALQIFQKKSKKCTRLGSPVLALGQHPQHPRLGTLANRVAQGAGMGTVAQCLLQSLVPFAPLSAAGELHQYEALPASPILIPFLPIAESHPDRSVMGDTKN